MSTSRIRRRTPLAARWLLGLGGFGNEVGEEAERTKHAVVSLGRVLKDAQELVGRQAKESPRLSVKFRPYLVTSHHNGFIFVRSWDDVDERTAGGWL